MAAEGSTNLLIDTREPVYIISQTKGVAQQAGLQAESATLEVGDFLWESRLGRVLVERKSAGDLISSLGSGRLQDQFQRMLESCDIPILLIEGKIGEYEGTVDNRRWKGEQRFTTQWNYIAFDHLLLSWQLSGIFLAHSPSQAQTPYRLIKLYQWTQKEEHSLTVRKRILTVEEEDPRVRFLCGLPGIGPKTASKILADNPESTILDIMNMEPHELAEVPGIGKLTAGKVKSFLSD